MSFFSRLRSSKSNKSKPVVPLCQDRCCYENAAYAAPSLSEAYTSKPRLTARNGILKVELGPNARPILKRSETFTMKDGPPDDDLPEMHLKCGTYTKKKKEPSIKTDVFEAMYTKRPAKVSSAAIKTQRPATLGYSSSLNASLPSPRSLVNKQKIPMTRPLSLQESTSSKITKIKIPAFITQQSAPASSKQTRSPLTLQTRSPQTRSAVIKTNKPREYLFGSTENPIVNDKKHANNKENDDRFKTITLRDVRRSFRDKYLANDKTDERRHQPIWFVDVKGNGGDVMREPEEKITATHRRRSQTRSIHDNDDNDDRSSLSFDRETFVAERSRSNSYRSDDSVHLRRSPSDLDRSSVYHTDTLQRSSSLSGNNHNSSNMYLTYKKGDSRFALGDRDRRAAQSPIERSYERSSLPYQSMSAITYDSRQRSPSPEDNKFKMSIDSVVRNFDHHNMDYEDHKPKVTVNRKNTFKVVRPELDHSLERPTSGSSLKRRDTFVVVDDDLPRPMVETPRGYYLNRYRRLIEQETPSPVPNERPSKVVPIGIATPYNSRNDRDKSSSPSKTLFNRSSRFDRTTKDEPNVRDESPPLYESTAVFRRKSPDLKRQSPVRRQSPDTRSSPTRRKSPEPRSPTTTMIPTKRPFLSRSSLNNIGDTLRKPLESAKISFESLRKPASPKRDPSQTNLGFDRFYDPNYYVPKNQNLFGPLASDHLRQVNLVVQPKKVHETNSSRSSWLYNKQ